MELGGLRAGMHARTTARVSRALALTIMLSLTKRDKAAPMRFMPSARQGAPTSRWGAAAWRSISEARLATEKFTRGDGRERTHATNSSQ